MQEIQMRGGCEDFGWIDDSLYDKVKSMVMTLMVKNESLFDKIEGLQKVKKKGKLINNS